MGIQKSKGSQNELFERNAKQLAVKVKNYESQKDDSGSSWRELEERLLLIHSQKRRKLRLNLLFISSIAASFLLVLGLSVWYFTFSFEPSVLSGLSTFSTDSKQSGEISLITSQTQFTLENESVVGYHKNGSISVNQKQIKASAGASKGSLSNELNHVIVPRGRRMHITLSDGTKLYVNAGSRVVYPTSFSKSRREIAVEGEVYLEVAHNPEWPFYVRTNGFNVKVLGTIFNISAYKDETVAAVTLVKGKVEVERKEKRMELLPDHAVFISANGMNMEEVDVLKYICWKDNLIFLNKDRLGSVLKRLSRYYGATVAYDTRVADIPLSGKLDLKEDIGAVLAIIEESLNLRCQKRGNLEFYFSNK